MSLWTQIITYLVQAMQIGSFNLLPLLLTLLAFAAGFRAYGAEVGAIMAILALIFSGVLVLTVTGAGAGGKPNFIGIFVIAFILSIAYAIYARYRGG